MSACPILLHRFQPDVPCYDLRYTYLTYVYIIIITVVMLSMYMLCVVV